nr:hypothetical protein [Frateuria defendens]
MLAAAAMLACLAGCHRPPDEARLRAAIDRVAQAAEAADVGGVTAPLSEDFDGNHGELDRRALGNLVRVFRLRHERIGVTMGPVEIEARGERRVARVTVTLTGGGGLLPDQAGIYRIESAWRVEDGDWHCYAATWERAM